MKQYKVVEKFVSINGEGTSAGQLAVFIRLAGCNLNCSYCDTKWANEEKVKFELMTSKDIHEYIQTTGVKNITLTGGEPLMQEGILELLQDLSSDENLSIEIETNGSVSLKSFESLTHNRPKFTMDYKLKSSNMEDKMDLGNFSYLKPQDTMKFVIGNTEDLNKAKTIVDKYELTSKANVYFSPVFGQIALEEMVEFIKDNKMNGVTLQVQLHKIIWAPEKRGV